MKRTAETIAVTALSVAVSLALAASASAGTYNVAQCSSAYGVGAPEAQAYDQTAAGRYTEQDFCFNESNGGGLLVFHGDGAGAVNGGVSAGWTFPAPANTKLVGIEAVGSGAQGAGTDYVPEVLAFSPLPAPLTDAFNFDAPIGGERTMRWDPSQIGDGSAFTIQLRCAKPVSQTCGDGSGNFINVRQITMTLSDSSAPQLTNAGSSLSNQASQRGTLSASYAANDAGAGIRAVSASVNGAGSGEANSSCSVTSGRAVRLVPCPLSVSGSIGLDTTQPPWQQGLNQTRFCAIEYADSAAASTCSVGPEVRVDNLCPVNGTQGIVGFEQLRFEGGKAGDGRATYGANVKLTGRAVDGADQPVAGAELCLGERIDLGPYTPEQIIRMPATDENGRFAVGLPSGPSRVFRIAQWQSAGNVVEQLASLAVKAKPRLAVRPEGKIREGKKTRLRVKLNRPVAADQTVEIQAKAPSGYVGLPQCSGPVDADGRLSCTDRLPKQPGPAAYSVQYRAVAPEVEGSAYLPGTSKAITKRVTG